VENRVGVALTTNQTTTGLSPVVASSAPQRKETDRDTKFANSWSWESIYARFGQASTGDWINVNTFDEFLEKRFPDSRRKAYYLMSIHENLPPQARKELKKIGWAKGVELAKIARRDRQNFNCATWLHKARELPKEEFQRAVERELTGKIAERWELVYFKFYENQLPVIERAIETAARMLGSDQSRAYCLEMICADFLAGANLDHGDPETLLFSAKRFFRFLSPAQKQNFLAELGEPAA